MSCPDKIPSYAEFLALQQRVNSLEQSLTRKADQSWVRDFLTQWILGEGLSKITLGVVGSGAFNSAMQGFTSEAMRAAGEAVFRVRRAEQNLAQMEQARKGFEQYARWAIQRKETLIAEVEKKVGISTRIANQAIEKAGKVDDLANGFNDVRRRIDSVQGAINTTAKRVDEAITTANRATSTAANAAGLASKLMGILGVIGGAAGLFAIYKYFSEIRPQLISHESRLNAHDGALASNRAIATNAINAANAAAETANNAQAIANSASATAATATATANRATTAANNAAATANNAQAIANSAQRDAASAQQSANAAAATAAATATELDRIKKEGVPLTPQQFNELKREHDDTQSQTQRIIRLIEGLPTAPGEGIKIPPELLAIPALVGENSRKLDRVGGTVDEIARNTTPEAQKGFAKAGVCRAFQPSECGAKALDSRIDPVNRNVKENGNKLDRLTNWLQATLGGQIASLSNDVFQLSQKLGRVRDDLFEKFNKTWDYLTMDRVLNLITTAATLHNAAMLSRNLLESLVMSVDGIIQVIGLKDAEGNPFSLSSKIAGGFRALINKTIGEQAARGISEKWNKLNRIISVGAAAVMSVQSVFYAIGEGIEIISSSIAHIGNGLRENGQVEDRQWPWMREGIDVRRFSSLDKFNQGLETAEQVTNNIYATVSAGVEIKDSLKGVAQAKQAFDQELTGATTQADTALDSRNTESDAGEITPSDLIRKEADEV